MYQVLILCKISTKSYIRNALTAAEKLCFSAVRSYIIIRLMYCKLLLCTKGADKANYYVRFIRGCQRISYINVDEFLNPGTLEQQPSIWRSYEGENHKENT